MIIAVFSLGVLPLVAGCSTPPTSPREVSAEQFWQQISPGSAEEVDPATSLEELQARSSVVVRASVSAVSAGPVDIDAQPEGEIKRTSTILTLQVAEWISGEPREPIKVWISSEYPGDGVASIPEGESVWFLRASERSDLLLMTALSGVIGETSNGSLATLRDPAQSEAVIPADAETVGDVEDAIE